MVDLGGNTISALGNADARSRFGARPDLFHRVGGFALTTFLSALETGELADIQAEPGISTLDNRQADILVGEETPIRVVDAWLPAATPPAPTCRSRRPVSGSRSPPT